MNWLRKSPLSRRKFQSETDLENTRYRRLFFLIIGGVAILAGVYFAFMPPKRDEETLCTKEKVRRHVVVLLDRTDRWTTDRGERLRREILGIRDSTLKDEKLSVYKFGGGDGLPERVFSLCNPGKKDEVNTLYQGGFVADSIFQKRFGQPITALLGELMVPAEAPHTYLVQAIQTIVEAPDFDSSIERRELLIFSDMRHNEPPPGFSFLHSSPSPASFTNYVNSVVPSQQLKGLKIRVYVIPHGRPNPALDSNVRAAWQSLFKALGIQFTWSSI